MACCNYLQFGGNELLLKNKFHCNTIYPHKSSIQLKKLILTTVSLHFPATHYQYFASMIYCITLRSVLRI